MGGGVRLRTETHTSVASWDCAEDKETGSPGHTQRVQCLALRKLVYRAIQAGDRLTRLCGGETHGLSSQNGALEVVPEDYHVGHPRVRILTHAFSPWIPDFVEPLLPGGLVRGMMDHEADTSEDDQKYGGKRPEAAGA